MNTRKPAIEIPKPGEDHPSWVKVGVIATLGFVIGVAWPRLAGIRIGPTAPVEAAPSASSAPAAPTRSAAPGDSALAAAAAPPAAAPAGVADPGAPARAAASTSPPAVIANRGVVLSCRTEDGEAKKGSSGCGRVAGFDAIAQPRLRKLAACPAAAGANGKLSIVFNIDFPSNHVGVELGRSSTVANIDGFAACLKPAFQGVSLGALDHDNPRYALLYSVVFSPPKDDKIAAVGTPAAPSSAGDHRVAATPSAPAAAPAADDGTAQVLWDVAIVRDTPRTGQVLARLQRGTKIQLGTGQDGWYRVKYGADFASEGWVYRGAIGR